jgi:PleD family two-component response regulator
LVEICDVIGALARAEALAGLPALIGELSLAFERAGCDLRSVEIDIAEQRSKQLEDVGSVGRRNVPKRGPHRVLLAESDPLIAKFLTASLRSAGFESDHTDDGNCALTLVREGRFDVLIIQAALRGLDGYELLSKIRLDPASHTTPVIVLSARRQEEEVLRAFELGADDFIPLPLNPLEITARVRRLVRKLYVWPTL